MTVVFDLDNTLVCAMPGYFRELEPKATLAPEQWCSKRPIPSDAPRYRVYPRPGAAELVRKLAAEPDARLVLWTVASVTYARAILDVMGILECFETIWGTESCDERELDGRTVRLKDVRRLERLGLTTSEVVFFDDRPTRVVAHDARLVPIGPFTGEPGDAAMGHVRALLAALARGAPADELAKVTACVAQRTPDTWYRALGWRWVYDP